MTGVVLLLLRVTLALALYAFLGWALFTIWRDLRQQKTSIQNQQLPEIHLQIINGDDSQSQVFRGTEIVLGRSPTCECTLQSDTVSARHAQFAFHHNQWWLEDLKSTNGTFINGEILITAVVVIPGDHIQCGEIEIIILEDKLE